MIFAIIEIDAGDEIGQFISFHEVINSIWEVFYFRDVFKIKF